MVYLLLVYSEAILDPEQATRVTRRGRPGPLAANRRGRRQVRPVRPAEAPGPLRPQAPGRVPGRARLLRAPRLRRPAHQGPPPARPGGQLPAQPPLQHGRRPGGQGAHAERRAQHGQPERAHAPEVDQGDAEVQFPAFSVEVSSSVKPQTTDTNVCQKRSELGP